jgi:hypothetical protein
MVIGCVGGCKLNGFVGGCKLNGLVGGCKLNCLMVVCKLNGLVVGCKLNGLVVGCKLNGLVVGSKLNVPKLEILLGVAGNRFEIYKSFKIDNQLCFKGFVVTSMLFSVSKTLGVCIEEFSVLFLRSSESSLLRANHLFPLKVLP